MGQGRGVPAPPAGGQDPGEKADRGPGRQRGDCPWRSAGRDPDSGSEKEPGRKPRNDREHETGDGPLQLPPCQVRVGDGVLEVAGQELQPCLRVMRCPAGGGAGPVGGGDKAVEQMRLHCCPIGQARVTQLGRITDGTSQFAWAGVIDGPGQPRHERRGQGLRNRSLGSQGGKDRSPAGRHSWSGRVIT